MINIFCQPFLGFTYPALFSTSLKLNICSRNQWCWWGRTRNSVLYTIDLVNLYCVFTVINTRIPTWYSICTFSTLKTFVKEHEHWYLITSKSTLMLILEMTWPLQLSRLLLSSPHALWPGFIFNSHLKPFGPETGIIRVPHCKRVPLSLKHSCATLPLLDGTAILHYLATLLASS